MYPRLAVNQLVADLANLAGVGHGRGMPKAGRGRRAIGRPRLKRGAEIDRRGDMRSADNVAQANLGRSASGLPTRPGRPGP
jgi:hypothetical protein